MTWVQVVLDDDPYREFKRRRRKRNFCARMGFELARAAVLAYWEPLKSSGLAGRASGVRVVEAPVTSAPGAKGPLGDNQLGKCQSAGR